MPNTSLLPLGGGASVLLLGCSMMVGSEILPIGPDPDRLSSVVFEVGLVVSVVSGANMGVCGVELRAALKRETFFVGGSVLLDTSSLAGRSTILCLNGAVVIVTGPLGISVRLRFAEAFSAAMSRVFAKATFFLALALCRLLLNFLRAGLRFCCILSTG